MHIAYSWGTKDAVSDLIKNIECFKNFCVMGSYLHTSDTLWKNAPDKICSILSLYDSLLIREYIMVQRKPVFWYNLRSDDCRYEKSKPHESARENHSEIGHEVNMKGNVLLTNERKKLAIRRAL